MFLFQSSTVSAQDKTSILQAFLSEQKALVFEAFQNRNITAQGRSDAISQSFNSIVNFHSSNYSRLSDNDKASFLAFVSEWNLWAGKMMGGSTLGEIEKGVVNDAISKMLASAARLQKSANAAYQGNLYLHSNFFSVLGMAADYSAAGKFITQPQAEMMAGFWANMDAGGKLSTYKSRQLVIAMIEAAAGGDNAPDQWTFNFAKPDDAKFFKDNILTSLAGFKASAELVGSLSVNFSLKQATTGAGEGSAFTAPLQIFTKTTPEKDKDGVYRLAKFGKLEFTSTTNESSYTTNQDLAFASSAKSCTSSMVEGATDQIQSTAVHYGKGYKSDKYLSQAAVDDRMSENIFNLAKRYGYVVQPPNLGQWLASPDGQEFLLKLNEVNVKLDVTGSADMAVYYDKNTDVWKTAANENLALAKERSEMAINYLMRLKNEVTKNYRAAHNHTDGLVELNFSTEVKGKVHFFQDFSDAEINTLKLGGYGYQQGEGKKNMTALVNYLQAAAEEGVTGVNVRGTFFSFSEDDKKDAAGYLKTLLESKAIAKDGGNYVAGNLSELNKYFRRKTGDPSLNGAKGAPNGMIFEGKVPLKKEEETIPPNIFARAIMQSTETSSRSVTISSSVEAGLGIGMGEIKDGKAEITVSYKFNGKDILFNENSGELHVYWRTGAGVQELTATQGEGGKFTVDNVPQGEGRLMAYAETKDGKLNSGYAWQSVAAEEKQFRRNTVQTDGRNVRGKRNEYITIPFYAVNNVTIPERTPYREKVDVRVAFVALGGKYQVLGFLAPGRNIVAKETCYSAGGKEIAIVRGITLNGTNYSKEDLLSKLNSRVVGIMVNGSVIALDGTTQLEMQGEWRKTDGLVSAPKVQQSIKKVVVREGLVSGQDFGTPREFHKDDYIIPYYAVLPAKDVKFGNGAEKLSPKQAERLAKQGYTALVRMIGDEAIVFDLNGNRLGKYSEADEQTPKVKGIYCYAPKKMQVDTKKAAPRGTSREDMPYWFNYQQKVYGPSDAAYIHGIIRPVTSFNEKKVE